MDTAEGDMIRDFFSTDENTTFNFFCRKLIILITFVYLCVYVLVVCVMQIVILSSYLIVPAYHQLPLIEINFNIIFH